jgi:uncharacterized membrane protein (UPF0127 family)
MKLSINDNIFKVKVQTSPKETQEGMMNKTFDKTFNGMLFVMKNQEHGFWMKNCIIPLDIIIIKNNVVVNIHHNCPPCIEDDCPSYCGNGNIVLELQGGTCDRLGISAGETINYLF